MVAKTRRRAFLLAGAACAAMALAAAGGVAFAVIPDAGTGVIHSCYDKTTGALRVIDPSKGQSCGSSEAALNWNGRGINWRGNWNVSTSYAVGDAVWLNNGTYIATAANTNSQPPNSNWATLGSPSYSNVFSESNQGIGPYPIDFGPNLTKLGHTGGVPAGSYDVSATVQLFMDDDAQDITCYITDNHGNFSNGYAETSGPPDPNNTGVDQTITLQDAFPQEPAATEFFLQCATANGADPNPSEAVSVTITASLVARMVYNGTVYSVH
jgi:hypothetical protein